MNSFLEQKTLAIPKKIYYDKLIACDWRISGSTTGEHVFENADRLGTIFCGTRAVFCISEPKGPSVKIEEDQR